jgi:hypothetical protein
MRKDYSHGTCVEDFLDESIAALMWHTYKWRYAESKSSTTKLACVVERER